MDNSEYSRRKGRHSARRQDCSRGEYENPNWEQVDVKDALSPNQPLKFGIERDGKVVEKMLTPEPFGPNQYGAMGWVPQESSVTLTTVEPGMPAEKAGLRLATVISANGQEIPAPGHLSSIAQPDQGSALGDGGPQEQSEPKFTVKPVLAPASAAQESGYRIGIASVLTKVVKLNFSDALNRSLSDNKKSSFLILELLQKMVQRKVSMRQVDGPIGIGSAVGAAAREKGWSPLFEITAAISLNLGIMNLLPIPILDGGVILLLFIESLMRKEISLPIRRAHLPGRVRLSGSLRGHRDVV